MDLVPHLRRCGYGEGRLATPFCFDEVTVPVAGFAGKPWDCWSACLAVVDLVGDSRASAARVGTLGAPTAFVAHGRGVDWWAIGPDGPRGEPRFIAWSEVGNALERERESLLPNRIYATKLRKPGSGGDQLWFFDAGLMPVVEKRRGETLTRLVEEVIGVLRAELGTRLQARQAQEDAYRTVFWLLAAKILHDKCVPNFIHVNLTDVDDVFGRIGRHHGETSRFPPFGNSGRPTIDAAAKRISQCGSLADVSSESLSHVYENALIDKTASRGRRSRAGRSYSIRGELGIHSTPSVLIQHVLSQLWPLVEEIRPEDRHVFEPACGHAPFLTAAMRWLRDWGGADGPGGSHRYLRTHLRGLEADPFALELAKLALTLADEPHGNRWDLVQADMFAPNVLARQAAKARILLANPPFERTRFPGEGPSGSAVARTRSRRKVDEMLARLLPNLAKGAVIGVVVPQGFLRSAESRELRKTLLEDWSLLEIATFEDKLFAHPDQETAILLARKEPPRAPHALAYRRVRNNAMSAFTGRLAFSEESRVHQAALSICGSYSLDVPELGSVWTFLREYRRLDDVAIVVKGFEFDETSIKENPSAESPTPKRGFEEVVRRADGPYGIHELPATTWVDFRQARLRRQGPVPRSGVPQLLVNYAPAGRDRWRLRVLLDWRGLAATRRFLVVRMKGAEVPLPFIWAILNSPIGNAFVASHCGKQDVPARVVRDIPLPPFTNREAGFVVRLVEEYLQAVASPPAAPLFGHVPPHPAIALRRLDGEILRLFGLPPQLERELLDYFRGERRKGVPFEFGDYFPPDFRPYVPLHEFISPDYRWATAGEIARRLEPVRGAAALAALDAAERLAAGD